MSLSGDPRQLLNLAPDSWRRIRLAQLGRFDASGIDKKTVEGETPVRMVNYTDVFGNREARVTSCENLMVVSCPPSKVERFQLKKGDVLFTPSSETVADIGIAAVVEADLPRTVFSYHLIRFRPTQPVVHSFRRHLFNSLLVQRQFSRVAKGTTRQILTRDDFRSVEVLIPPLQAQRAIADFLDRKTAAIDSLIEKQQQLVERLVEEREALINQAVTKGLDPTVPMKDSGIPSLGKVPAHWDITRNKVLGQEVTDLSTTGSEELLTVSHLTGVTPRSQKNVFMFLAETHVGYKRVQPGDLVINTMWAWMAAFGFSLDHGIVSPAYGVYRFDKKRMFPEFFDLFYRTRQYVCEMTRYSKGVWSSRLRLYPESFLALLVSVPPLEEQRAIVRYITGAVGRHPEAVLKLEKSIERLQEYRQGLVTAAVTGQLDIGEAA